MGEDRVFEWAHGFQSQVRGEKPYADFSASGAAT